LLDKPITVYTRNQSFDDFLTEMILLRRELIAIGKNFNQLVKRLHIINLEMDVKRWVKLNEKTKELFFQKVEEINNKISQIDASWSRE
jgi:GT2 family glycosyltransferase